MSGNLAEHIVLLLTLLAQLAVYTYIRKGEKVENEKIRSDIQRAIESLKTSKRAE